MIMFGSLAEALAKSLLASSKRSLRDPAQVLHRRSSGDPGGILSKRSLREDLADAMS